MTRRRRDAGYTLMVSLMVIFALIGTGVAAAWLASMGTNVATNLNTRQAALNAATAGIQHGRNVLAAYANNASLYCPSNTASPWSCALAGKSHAQDAANLPRTAKPTGIGAVVHDGTTPLVDIRFPSIACTAHSDCTPGGNGICQGGFCTGLGSYTVWVRNDPAEINRAALQPTTALADAAMIKEATPGTVAVILRAAGRDASGQALVVVESAVTQFSNSTASGPANLTFGKNVDQFGTGSISGAISF